MTRASMLTGVGLTALVTTSLIRTAFMKTTLQRNKVFVRFVFPLSRKINHATCNVNIILTFESEDEILLWCDQSNETFTFCYSKIFSKEFLDL